MKRDQFNLLLLTLIVAGCKSTHEFGLNEDRLGNTRKLVEKTILDHDRRNEMLLVVDSLERESRLIGEKAMALRDRISEANRNYETPRQEFETLYSNLEELIVQYGKTAEKHSLELKNICSQEEWLKIAAHKTQAVHFTF